VRAKRVDLRKVNGEENPADIFTKHFCARDKLRSLVSLFGGAFIDGRADSAPQVKKGMGTKIGIGQALAELNNAECPAKLPHLAHELVELNKLYPSAVVPEEDGGDDYNCSDDRDGIWQTGLAQARAIAQAAAHYGRKRNLPGTA
jgi:hypothetical protein